ncbi:DUF3068 domain-containing protein [Gordonia polyisoprenivorans]|uniref:DUF3068 domain-containing protein n=1 Tax=Gordonia polyisoprenivorans TaxID=84595 RepID=UPI002300ABEA|nr:DUF3068 domain-containing protein [Gordonia polyisoprenivorans]WCB38038.1 DUF3068 domain-containing protein [Gordonia polyisoprenivorans]
MPEPGADDRPRPSRWSTRDLLGPTIIFLGGFLLAAALALPTLLVGQLELIPLSTDVTTVATSVPTGDEGESGSPAPTATILDRCSLNTPMARTLPATLVRQQRVVAVRPADKRVITLQAGTSVQGDRIWLDGRIADADAGRPGSEVPPASGESACTDPTLSAFKDRVTLSRRSATPDLGANSTGAQGNSEIQYDSNAVPVAAPDRTGYTYVLPFGVSVAEHTFFDPTTRRSVPLTPQGDAQVDGRSAQRFVAEVPDTDLDATRSGVPDGVPPTRITRPASWFGVGGDPARQLTATLHQSSRWELSVDTSTGTILDERVTIDQAYRLPDPAFADFRLTNLQATFAYDDATRNRLSDLAGSLSTPLVIWGRVVPIVAAVLGVVAVVGGLVLTIGSRRAGE